MEHFAQPNNLEIEKKELSDSEFIEQSQAFGEEYLGLINGEIGTDFQTLVSEKVEAVYGHILEKTKDLEGEELSRFMVEGYRNSLNRLYEQHDSKAPFESEQLTDRELARVLRAKKGPFGVPILYTDGFNEELFGDDNLSFASADLMLENQLPPIAVVYENYNPAEKEQVTTHETSHTVFALLRRIGVIAHPDSEGITVPGQTSAFELARDEAIAQMAANQNSGGHPDVIRRMKKEGYSEDEISAFRSGMLGFGRREAEKAGLKFSDAILGVAMAKNFAELNSHMYRMHSVSARLAS